MRITNVQHQLVKVPFTQTIHWGSGVRDGTTRLICRIETECGTQGWGETQCLIDTVPAAFERVAELAVGMPVANAEQLFRKVMGAGYYHHKRAAVMAIAALEMAMWDAFGKIAKQPLWALWGGRWRQEVRAAAYTFTRDPNNLREQLKAFAGDGYRDFKVKVGFDEASDLDLAQVARETIGNDALRLDVNGAWNPGTAKRQLEKLKSYDPAYVEQPLELDDLVGTAALRGSQPVPIALDESAYTLQDVGTITKLGAADYVLLDPHQAGGLWQVIKAAGICEAHGIQVGLHSGAELAFSQAAYVHLATSIANMSLAIDTERKYLASDISARPPRLTRGAFEVLDTPGLGVEPDEAQLARFKVDTITGAYLNEAKPDWFPTKPQY